MKLAFVFSAKIVFAETKEIPDVIHEVDIPDFGSVKFHEFQNQLIFFSTKKHKVAVEKSGKNSFFLECPCGTLVSLINHVPVDSVKEQLISGGKDYIEKVFRNIQHPEIYEQERKAEIEERARAREESYREQERIAVERETKRKESLLARFRAGELIGKDEFLELLNDNNIPLAARTKGWINDKLIMINKEGKADIYFTERGGKKIPKTVVAAFFSLQKVFETVN